MIALYDAMPSKTLADLSKKEKKKKSKEGVAISVFFFFFFFLQSLWQRKSEIGLNFSMELNSV